MSRPLFTAVAHVRSQPLAAIVLLTLLAGLTLGSTSTAGQTQAGASRASDSKLARTPWGDPDLQGYWTTNEMHGVPLERPAALAGKTTVTQDEALKRREATTQGTVTAEGIGNYDRAFRDTALGYTKQRVSTQASLIVDPSDGKLPPMTPEAEKRAAAARGRQGRRPVTWEDLGMWGRCITRGVETIVAPSGYNNGVQIVQGPGYVAIQKEMIHETRIVPLDTGAAPGPKLTAHNGIARGRWEGDTLVVELTNFDGKVPLVGAGKNLRIVERFRRLGPDELEYQYTVEDGTVWTKPWTARMTMSRDAAQYELVEYACHEANYSLTNSLSAARAEEKAEEDAKKGRK
jgi:hypothetical protein